MNNKFIALIIVIIIAICGVSAFLLTQNNINNNGSGNDTVAENNTGNNTMVNNTNNTTIPSGNTNNKGITDQNGVIASLNGPKYSVQGKTVKLIWKITNNGSEPIQNVKALDQSDSHNFGNIAPGESKTFTTSLNIPTLGQLQQDFGPGATITNPFYIGGFSVSYNLDGKNSQFNSNSIKIQLV